MCLPLMRSPAQCGPTLPNTTVDMSHHDPHREALTCPETRSATVSLFRRRWCSSRSPPARPSPTPKEATCRSPPLPPCPGTGRWDNPLCCLGTFGFGTTPTSRVPHLCHCQETCGYGKPPTPRVPHVRHCPDRGEGQGRSGGRAQRGRSPRGEASPWCRDLPRWPSTNSVGIGGFTSVDSDVVPALFKERVDRYTLAVLKQANATCCAAVAMHGDGPARSQRECCRCDASHRRVRPAAACRYESSAVSSAGQVQLGRSTSPAIMIAMPTAEIYTLLLAGLLVGGVLWVVTRFMDRD